MIFNYLITFFIILSIPTYAQNTKVLKFAPLPTKKASKNIEEFIPVSKYLEKKVNIKFDYIVKKDYKDILDSFKNGTIDIAYLGPLPLVYLRQNYKHMKPIISFKQSNGSEKYRCVIAKFKNDKYKTDQKIKVALTQPLSTCGYYMTQKLLKKRYNINLDNHLYNYEMSHYKALSASLRGDYFISGAKDSIALKYESLGMEVIEKSDLLPGFSLVVNTKTVSKKDIEKIENTLLSIPKKQYKSWTGIASRGMIKSSIEDYKDLEVDFSLIPQKGNI